MPATSARVRDPNGFLLVKGCPISSYGVFKYSAAQIGLDGDPNRIVNVFRPESAVNEQGLIDSLQHVPLINDHEMLSGFDDDENATAPETKGIDGVLFGVSYAKPWLRGDVKLFSRSMQQDLASGKCDLSLGYTCDFFQEPGVFDGVPYEVVQTNMRGNHIALVDSGRVPGAKVLDGMSKRRLCFDHLDFNSPSKEPKMAKIPRRKTMDDDAVANLRAQLKALLPAFEQFLNEEAAEPAHAGADPTAAAAAPAATADPTAAAAVPSDPAESGAAPPPTDATAPAVAAAPAAAAPDAGALLAKLEAICAEFKAAMGGGEAAEPAASAPPEGGGEGDEGGGEAEPPANEGEGEDEDPNLSGDPAAAAAAEGDAVEGLAEDPNSQKINTDSDEGAAVENNGKASPGPAAGKHTGADAAMRAVYRDMGAKTKLYERLSKVVGAFDAAIDLPSATAADVAAYGIKKLKLNAPKGQETAVLDAYLLGIEATRRAVPQQQATAVAADSAADVPAIAAYLKE